MNIPSLSIIIPLYRSEPYLERLFTNLSEQGIFGAHAPIQAEVIFVDDGSPDNSAAIVSSFATTHPNVRLLRQPNSGQGTARNNAIRMARMECVYMMDSDDLLQPGFLIPATKALLATDADMLRFRLKEISAGDIPSIPEQCPPVHTRICTGSEFITLSHGMWREGSVCTSIFRRTFIEQAGLVFDPEIRFYEDMLFMWQAMLEARSVAVSDITGYYYIQYPHSDSHNTEHTHKVKLRLTLPSLSKGFLDASGTTPGTTIRKMLLEKSAWYEFAFWSMVISERAMSLPDALAELDRHTALGIYPPAASRPDTPGQYPRTLPIRARWQLISHPHSLRLLLRLRLCR